MTSLQQFALVRINGKQEKKLGIEENLKELSGAENYGVTDRELMCVCSTSLVSRL